MNIIYLIMDNFRFNVDRQVVNKNMLTFDQL